MLIGLFIGCNFLCACSCIKEGLTGLPQLTEHNYYFKNKPVGNIADWYKNLETNKQNGI
jgi:hypothetical protein